MQLCVSLPWVTAGDFNVEPIKIPCVLKGISAGLWVDLQGAWARAASVEPDVTCKRDGACIGKTRIYSGLSLAAAALGGCWVDCCCWIQPHLSVMASFVAGRWSEGAQPVWFSPLWPVSWVSAVDKSRKSKSTEVDKSRKSKSAEVGEVGRSTIMVCSLFRLHWRFFGRWRCFGWW